MTYDEIIEVLARAIYKDTGGWAIESELTKSIWRHDARAALSVLRTHAEERRYRLMVPVEATDAMDEAGMKEADIHDEWGEPKYVTNAPAVFRAMLSAAPDPTKETPDAE